MTQEQKKVLVKGAGNIGYYQISGIICAKQFLYSHLLSQTFITEKYPLTKGIINLYHNVYCPNSN